MSADECKAAWVAADKAWYVAQSAAFRHPDDPKLVAAEQRAHHLEQQTYRAYEQALAAAQKRGR